MKYVPIIGLETHIELSTESKMFCGCSANYFGQKPNTHTCPVCLGLPGALPVANKIAIESCIKIALALNCTIANISKFDRKNYFYPDLPKGYQISQYDMPFGEHGWIELSNGRKIGITRVHMEEDTGKLTHAEVDGQKVSLIDFNRSSVPLVEIVTDPDFHDALEVKEYLQKLQQIVRYLGVSNADMEKGDMRLEPNISVAKTTDKKEISTLPPYKVEVKNINSFRFVEKAINFEVKRHIEILEKGDTPIQETRGWNENKNNTFSQRVKEEANDYRYFPEPDIPPFRFENSYIEELKKQIPELPDLKTSRFISDYSLSDYDAEILTREKNLADYFEEAVAVGKDHDVSSKQIANIIINKKIDITQVLPASLVKQIVEENKVESIDESELNTLISEVLKEHEKAVQDFKSGKESVIMFLLGQVMRKLGKKVDTQLVLAQIKSHLQA
ncbi:MAG TPA: Asp-tRNA(Asn)/Glu-tRNA(Gln) amidotransferase subunit GatB [Candidatus Levybacteria bacterium]|nr:Asp-tRNA(Asn)/Glu-tRNA(Gln) amidotransferase subunit GatB [Candidatus Levybacteria bacterium]